MRDGTKETDNRKCRLFFAASHANCIPTQVHWVKLSPSMVVKIPVDYCRATSHVGPKLCRPTTPTSQREYQRLGRLSLLMFVSSDAQQFPSKEHKEPSKNIEEPATQRRQTQMEMHTTRRSSRTTGLQSPSCGVQLDNLTSKRLPMSITSSSSSSPPAMEL